MSRAAERIAREQQLSVLDWMGTLFVSMIPVVNIIVFFVWQVAPVKKVRQRFGMAALLLCTIFALLFFVAFMIWGNQIVSWLESIQG